LLSDAFDVAISLVCQFSTNVLAFNSNETQDSDGELQLSQQNMQNQVVQVLNPFFAFMHSF
jgi:hypothetical protein